MDDDDAADDDGDDGRGGNVSPFAIQDGAVVLYALRPRPFLPPSVRPSAAAAVPSRILLSPASRALQDRWMDQPRADSGGIKRGRGGVAKRRRV